MQIINNKTINAARGFLGNMTLVVRNSHLAETILVLLFAVKIYSGSHTSIAVLKLDIKTDSKNRKQMNLVLIFLIKTKCQKCLTRYLKLAITYSYHLHFQIIKHTDTWSQMNNLRTREPIYFKALIINVLEPIKKE